MAISEEDIAKVREASDIVAIMGERVPLRQRGRDFWCCCPFHNEKTPSCKIDPVTQLWHCFGCGDGGDVFGFIMKADDLSFPDAVRYLADRAHIDIKETGGSGVSQGQKARLRAVCAETDAFYHMQLMRGKSGDAAQARNYLSKRGFGGEVPRKWHLGFAPGRGALVRHLLSKGFTHEEMILANVAVQRNDERVNDRFYNRVMFPINDPQGECIAFGGRVIGDGEPKYLNSQETPLFHKSNVLYGLDKAKKSMTSTGVAIIVEGYTDVIALHENGIENAVATLGTALTIQHIRLISKHASKRIVYLFDGDAAGQRAADRALAFINEDMTPEAGKSRIELCAVTLPNDLDPADYVIKHGAESLRELVDGAIPLVLYGIERRLAQHDLTSAEGRSRAMTESLSILAPIKGSLLAKDYAVQLASRLQMREEDALAALERVSVPRYTRDDDPGSQEPIAQNEGRVEISESEKSRRKFELRLLSLFAQNPVLAVQNADALAQTQWSSSAHSHIAEQMLEALSEDPGLSAAALIARISRENPRLAGALTMATVDQGESTEQAIAYLVEELEIGDMERSLAVMRSQLKDASDMSDEDHDILFHSVVELQKTLTAKRASHKPHL